MDKILLTVSTALYFLISLSIIHKIFGYKITGKLYILIYICLICGLFSLAVILPEDEFSLFCALFHFIQIILIYLSISKFGISSVIALYSFIYSFISVLVIAINSTISLTIKTLTVIEFVVHILFTILTLFFCYYDKSRQKIQQIIFIIPRKIKALTIFALCTSTLLTSLILSNPEMYVASPWSIAVRISLIFFSLFICTTFPVLIITVLTNTYLKRQNERFERELKAQAEHYIALAEANKELSRFKHDFKNLRIGITKALSSGDSEIALEMIEKGHRDFIEATEKIIKFNTGNGIVDAILSEKQKKAFLYNIYIKFDGIIPQTAFSPTDLCVIFGNTLDNAIEACEKMSDDTEKLISVSVKFNSGFAFISISNPVLEKVILHNNFIETTKTDRASHGFGLHSLRRIADKYEGEMNIISEEHLFTLTLDLSV